MNSIVFKGVIIRGVCFFKHNNIFLYIKKIQDVSQFVNFANDLITRAFVRINESNVITLYKNRCIDNLKLYFFFFFIFSFFFFQHENVDAETLAEKTTDPVRFLGFNSTRQNLQYIITI